MADLYTSFSTSLALRDAGAPQDGRFVRRANGDVIEAWGSRLAEHAPEHFVACFRADEIVEALGQELCAVFHVEADGAFLWEVELLRHDGLGFPIEAPDVVRGRTLVEALAAAWLAVLKEEGR